MRARALSIRGRPRTRARRAPVAVAAATALLLAGCLLAPEGDAPLRYRDAVFASVAETTDIPYASPTSRHTGEPVTLRADLYEPADDDATARPAIVWVHGGSFRAGNKASPELVDQARTFAAKGYVNVSINYRLSPTGCTSVNAECLLAIVDAREDAQTAVRWLRSEAQTYRVDPGRIAIGGSSAGAITALNVAVNVEPTGSDREYPTETSSVAAAASISGAAIPATTVGPASAPMLIMHNEVDPLVPYAWAQATHEQAIAAARPAYLVTWPGSGHVPYAQHRDQIQALTTNFFYWSLDIPGLAG